MEWVRSRMENSDPIAAERLLSEDAGLTDEQRVSLAQELARNFRRMDPRVLARIILGLPHGEVSDRLLWRFVADWSASNAEDALRFVEALPADRLNTVGVLQNAAFGLIRLPAERVLAFAARLDGKGRACLAEGLVAFADQAGSWRNTTAILSKLDARPQEGVISVEWQLGTLLAEIDPQVVEDRIAAEADAAMRDEMLGGYAWITGIHDPPRGIELDAQIESLEIRAANLRRHTSDWLKSDRAAALGWLQTDAARQLISREELSRLLRLYGMEAAP